LIAGARGKVLLGPLVRIVLNLHEIVGHHRGVRVALGGLDVELVLIEDSVCSGPCQLGLLPGGHLIGALVLGQVWIVQVVP
jgi:hypothetical protein